jgi:hypothetical protein
LNCKEGEDGTTRDEVSSIEAISETLFFHNYIEPKFLNTIANIKNGFSVISQNVRSLLKNGDSLESLINGTQPTVAAVQEIWHSATQFEGYTLCSIERQDRRGGGVGLLVSDKYSFKEVHSQIGFNLEIICIEIDNKLVCSVYIPPKGNVDTALKELEQIIRKSRKKERYIAGDFNINTLTDSFNTKLLEDFCAKHEVFPTIVKPTRITANSATLIDQILTNSKKEINSGIVLSEVSDHLAPFLVSGCIRRDVMEEKLMIRQATSKNLDKLDKLLINEEWPGIETAPANELYTIFIKKFNELFDLTCPLVEAKRNRSAYKEKPWYTRGLLNSRNRKVKLKKAFIRTRSNFDLDKYILYKKLYDKVLRAAQSLYWTDFFNNNMRNTKKVWFETNRVIGRARKPSHIPKKFLTADGRIIEGSKEIADGFNTFFTSVGSTLAEKFEYSDKFETYITKKDLSFKFHMVNSNDIAKVIKSMKNKGSTGFDGISNKIVKHLSEGLIGPLSYIVNVSLSSGYVPEELKIAKVIPLYKSGKTNDFSNYRPISLLNIFSKILEKCVYKQVYSFFAMKILTKTQFGFREGSETLHCVLNFLRNMDTDSPKHRAAVFVDLKKAFDTVSHKILLRKLELYGFDPISLQWFRNYLNERKQRVFVHGSTSKSLLIDCGVPQGSILGPLLFLIFINDLPDNTKFLTSLFADDTTFQSSADSIDELETKIQFSLDEAADWFDSNQLTLHPNKTRYILFHSKGKSLNISLKGVKLTQVSNTSEELSFKFLGVHIDESLSWSSHVTHVKKKLSNIYFALCRYKNYFPAKLKINLYNALFKSYMEYCLPIWGEAKSVTVIDKIQKRMVRALFYGKGFAHSEPILKKYGILKLKDLYHQRVIITCYKIRNEATPESLHDLFVWDESSRRRGEIKIPGKIPAHSYKLPAYTFAQIWNLHQKDDIIRGCTNNIMYCPKIVGKNVAISLMEKYQESCTTPNCYFCTETEKPFSNFIHQTTTISKVNLQYQGLN